MYVALKGQLLWKVREEARPGKTITITCLSSGGYKVEVGFTPAPFVPVEESKVTDV